ncbi:phasin family protein [Oceaniglobus roseus]|uniref:phasin family protein n=1 Tax=Oceaniglobus roseus TaxID=1737570 RepID=UPI0012FFF5B6|nr:phasin family protein [Kandeliimicrobium roseum]
MNKARHDRSGMTRRPWPVTPEAWPLAGAAEAWMDIGSEAWTFWAHRLRKDVETQHALLHSRTPFDAQVILAKHFHNAMEDYHREAGRLVQLLHVVPGAAVLIEE